MNRTWSLTLYLFLSFMGAVLLIFASVLSMPNNEDITLIESVIVGGLFIFSSILGISLALRPNWIRRLSFDNKPDSIGGNPYFKANSIRKGHHPVCSDFQNHTIWIIGKTYCAGCLGLTIGCIISILSMILFIVIIPYISLTSFVLFISIGLVIITFSYIETILIQRTSAGHVMSNAMLVIGTFLVVSGVFGSTGNPILGALAVLIAFLWIDTRIQLSHWNHERICKNCRSTCKAY